MAKNKSLIILSMRFQSLLISIHYCLFIHCFWLGVNLNSKSLFVMSKFQKSKRVDVKEAVTKAIDFHKAGDVENALINYELALPLLTGNTKASLHGNAGALYMQLGNFEKAKEHFQLSVDTNPNNSQTHFNLAVLLTSKLNLHAKAIKHCGLAIKLDPQNHKAQHLMGNIMQSIGRPEEAERYFVLAESIALEKQEQAEPRPVGQSAASSVKLNGWDSNHILDLKPNQSLNLDIDGTDYIITSVSTTPYIFTVDNFISGADCSHIRSKASSTLERSFIMGGGGAYDTAQDNKSTEKCAQDTQCDAAVNNNAYRSSYNTWLTPDATLLAIQTKLSRLLGLSLPYLRQKSEDLQVVQYHGPVTTVSAVSVDVGADGDVTSGEGKEVQQPAHGGQFKVHHDSSAFHTRYLTALIYLNNITSNAENNGEISSVSGGETWFPFATTNDVSTEGQFDHIMSVDQANAIALSHYDTILASNILRDGLSVGKNRHDKLMGLKVAPKEGRVVIFFNHNPETGELDPLAVHAGLPVRRTSTDGVVRGDGGTERVGDKWVANYWVGLDKKMLTSL